MKKISDEFGARWGEFADEYGPDGCETCGYTEDKNMSEDKWRVVLAEMDEWIAKHFGGMTK